MAFFDGGVRWLDVFYLLFDVFTRAPVTYRETTVWHDGTPMTDAKCDWVTYCMDIKKGQKVYYRRIWDNDLIQLESYGVLADGEEHGQDLQDALNYFTTPQHFAFPRGRILLDVELNFRNHSYVGKGNILTFLSIAPFLNGPRSVLGCKVRNLQITSRGKSPAVGRLPAGNYPNAQYGIGFDGDGQSLDPDVQKNYILPDFFVRDSPLPAGTYPNAQYPAGSYWTNAIGKRYAVATSNAYSTRPDDHPGYGFACYSICVLEDVIISGFPKGIDVYGDVNNKQTEAPAGYNASRSYFNRVGVEGCTFPWVFNGGDANQCTITACEARNCEGFGVYDMSLLGNHYKDFHVIDADLGAYYVRGTVNRSTFVGCYSEGGNFTTGLNRPAQFGGFATVIGGIHASGLVCYDAASYQQGNTFQNLIGTYLKVGKSFVFGDSGFAFYPTGQGWKLGAGGFADNLFQFFKKGALIQQGQVMRGHTNAGIALRNVYQSGYLVGAVYDIANLVGDESADDYNYQAHMFTPNDVLQNQRYNGTNPPYWRCTQGGSRAAYTEGLTATCLQSFGRYQLSGPTSVLQPGDYLVIAGVSMRILSVQSSTLFTTSADSPATNAPIAYSPPRFRAEGQGSGTTAQRPTLRADDAGWPYWNTDNGGSLQRWNGTQFN